MDLGVSRLPPGRALFGAYQCAERSLCKQSLRPLWRVTIIPEQTLGSRKAIRKRMAQGQRARRAGI